MRKIGGVLIQSSVQGNYMKHFITGIGININQQLFLSDAPNPVSLTQLTGKTYKLESCLKKCTGFIDLRLEDLKTGNYKSLREEYHQRLFRIDEYHPFSLKEKQIIGRIKGVNHYGQLLLVTRDGQNLSLNMKDVKYVL
jgi:BirA family biotin operon repressor/biotin-[acetyl-CoA-carboxylase] ligase